MKWPRILRRDSFSHARRIGWISKVAVNPFFARATALRGDANHDRSAHVTSPGVLPVVAEGAGAIFSILLSSVLIVFMVAVIVAFVIELRRDAFTFEGVSVPKELQDLGFSPAATAEEIITEINRIQRAASTRHQKRNLESLVSLPDLQLLSSGLSMNSVVRYARRLLSLPEDRISGKILADGTTLTVVISVRQGPRSESLEVSRSDGNVRALLRDRVAGPS